MPCFSPHNVAGSTTSARFTDSREERVDRDHRADAVERFACEGAVGEVGQRVAAEHDERVDLAGRGRAQDVGGVEPCRVGNGTPRGGERGAAVGECDTSGKHARREPELERAVHVAAPQRRQEADVRELRERRRRAQRRVGPLGQRAATEHHDDRALALAQHRGGPGDRIVATGRIPAVHDAHEALGHHSGLAGRAPQRDRRRAHGRVGGREVDDRHTELHGGPAHAQVQHRQLFLEHGAEQHDRGGPVAVGDPRAGKTEHHLGRQPVAELGVDVIGAEHALGEPGPRVGVFVAAARATEHRDAARTVQRLRPLEDRGRGVERLGPRLLDERAAAAHQRIDDPRVVVHVLESVPTLVAQPAVIHRLGIDAEKAHEPVARRLQRTSALHCARVARRLDRREIPRPRAKPVRLRGERADRADLHGVTREVRREGMVGKVEDLGSIAAVDEGDQRVARDLVGEPGAARTGCSARGRAAPHR